jgi:uncharacterized protein (DUF885 family)
MLSVAAACVLAGPAFAAPADDLKQVISDHWAWWLKNNPIQATTLGVHDYDDQLPDISLAAQDRQAKEEQAFLDRLKAIPDAGLNTDQRVNKAVLSRILRNDVEGNRFGERMMLFTTYYGWHQGFAGLADDLPFHTGADYRSYLTRLSKYPEMNDEALAITRKAVAAGFVQPCDAIKGFEKSIIGVVTDTPETSRFYQPFTRKRPIDVTPAEWEKMQARAKTLIQDTVNPEYREFYDYYVKDYAPRCRKTVGASAMPEGEDYYAYRARVMTTTDMTPEQIHELGLSEVKRIRAEMDEVAKKAGFPSRQAFIEKLRTDPVYYPKSAEELMAAAALMAKTIDGKMPGFFGKLPRLPYGIRAIPAETAEGTTTAYYSGGSPESGIAGTYYVNTSKLDQRPLYELPALTAHEAVPGHHNQIALQQELDLPEFRKHIAHFTAFTEGWGLYSERIGIEMGLYDTPAKDMGRLSYEMWRACRLVVDTGMHAKGWTKQQAVDFMLENTALSAANIDAEVNRYITWPGQALAYKIGELKIRELRAKAEKALGTKFDLRAFHDAVLENGSIPLDILEAHINEWIAAQEGKA